MGATTQVTTFSDLYTDLQNRVRVTTSVTATENQAKRYINTALQDIHMNYDYRLPWAERRGVLITHATYTVGTVSVSVGGTAVTGASTLWNTATSYGFNNARVGGKMTISGGTDIYSVTAVGGDTSITLGSRYVPTTAASAASYIYFEDEYALASDFLRPIDAQFFSNAWAIPFMSRLEFRRRFPRPNVQARPYVACMLDQSFNASTTPVRRIQFYPAPDAVYMIPYDYVTSAVAVTSAGVEGTALSGDTDEPTMPLRYRHIIVLHALVNWYRDKRDDVRSQEAMAVYSEAMGRLVADVEVGTHNKAQISPRMGMYASHAKRPYSIRGGRYYDVNGRFDRFDP